ncbi:hypothetical protein LPJ66_003749 [Kickxella alabastrina]|uniref:Uncharacterized protein n=1 Tax=Kickxella alabastrina TaxID=61397 RepID=A0ACC1IJX1_9FUNG|nr:hypothetical protein LPJ66_003749 [Kickxella alabastrina]
MNGPPPQNHQQFQQQQQFLQQQQRQQQQFLQQHQQQQLQQLQQQQQQQLQHHHQQLLQQQLQQQNQHQQQQLHNNSSVMVVETQQQSINYLLQNLERLEQTGNTFFKSLEMVGQGPPSLLAAQLVAMSQICQQMRDNAQSTAMLNVPIARADPVFTEPADILPRSEADSHAGLASVPELEAWVQGTAMQTSELFVERRRLTANVQAALSVPPPKRLDLK